MTSGWPITLVPIGDVACGAVLWRWQQQLMASVVVKAGWRFDPRGTVERTAAEGIRRELGRGPGERVGATSDLAPHLARADVWLEGQAPASGPRRAGARLRLVGSSFRLDRFLGDHDPGFGLLSIDGPRRAILLRAGWRALLGLPLLCLPNDMPWDLFQAAPHEQQVPYLEGGEKVQLVGLHPTVSELTLMLPDAVGHAWTGAPSAALPPTPLALRIDGLGIDLVRQRLTLRWRGSFSLEPKIDPRTIGVAAGVTVGAEVIDSEAARSALGELTTA